MALDPKTYGEQAETELEEQIDAVMDGGGLSPEDMSKEFAAVYHDYAREGECGGVDIAAGGDQAVLDPAFVSDNSAATIEQLAQALCDYWDTFDTEGEAQELDVVTDVSPQAQDQVSAMETAIEDYIASGDDRDGWVGWYEATEAVVKQIEFLVTEQDTSTGSTQTFTRFVS
ncbi:MAG: hypothetical protein ACOC7J_05645 [Armatimonadota bacterium]